MRKTLLVILLVVLVVLLSLPATMAMGMDMSDASCPACDGPERSVAGMCLAILTLVLFAVIFTRSSVTIRRIRSGDAPELPGLFRPPRSA